jgi:TusA-related sulfurtransferase
MGRTHQQVQFILAQKMQKNAKLEVLTTQPASQYCTIQGFLRVSILQKRGCSIQALHQLAGAPLIDFWAG